MGKRVRPGVVSQLVNNLINSFRGVKKIYVGKDHFNNVYYQEENFRATNKPKNVLRGYVPGNTAEWQKMPVEWEEWLRNRRKDAPTEEEIKRNAAIMENMRREAFKSSQTVSDGYSEKDIPNVSPEPKPWEGKTPFPERDGLETRPGVHQTDAFEGKDFEKTKK